MPDAPYIRDPDGTVREGRSVQPSERWAIEVDAPELSFMRIDHQCRLQFGRTEIVIVTEFTLAANGRDRVLDPGDRAALGPFVALYPDTLLAAWSGVDCALHLEFASGASIEVRQHDHYEAWQVNGAGTRLIVCPPAGGGDLSVWR